MLGISREHGLEIRNCMLESPRREYLLIPIPHVLDEVCVLSDE